MTENQDARGSDNEQKLLGYLKKVTGDLRQAHHRLREIEAAETEPIAIVGMACRFPGGVRNPLQFWELLERGGDGMSAFPQDRYWNLERLHDPDTSRPGTSLAHDGGFVYDAAEFDAGFFGMSPREAVAADPQQRLLLQASWEALENAGINPAALKTTNTGVFVGAASTGYGSHVAALPEGVEGYLLTGTSMAVASGRVAYTLGLKGPAVTVDTACSSSLVAIHLAAQSLRSAECSLALVGGVTVMSTPGMFLEFSRQHGLSADGRCKAFSEDADGTGWSEGVGILVLARLADARRLGHRVLAVVRGTAVNQDGASNGLTVPNGPSQQLVIRKALENARLSAADVDVVEAHGTGTSLGDPIEAQALLATYGQGRGGRGPLWLGSVKSNIGHTQAAAGVAGVMKMVLALQHERLPKTLYAETPSSHVDWSSGAVELLTESRAWPRDPGRPRRSGVSSFGISGTNAHIVIEEAPLPEAPLPETEPEVGAPNAFPVPWLLSAKRPEAIAELAARLHAALEARPESATAADIAYSLATGRATFDHRAALVATADAASMLADLEALAAGRPSPDACHLGTAAGRSAGSRTRERLAFVFSGQGGQRVGMGRVLAGTFPVFDAAFSQVCAHFDAVLDRALRGVMFEGPAGVLEGTGFAQPALFALEVALFRLFESWGVVPDFLVGHSVGELAAAHVAGVLSLEDACVLVAARAGLMQSLPAGGAMWAVRATVEEVAGLLPAGVSVASVNAPGQVVVSGDRAGVEAVAAQLADRRGRWLPVSHAFHSALMDPMLAEFAEVAEQVAYHPPGIPIVSTLTGEIVEGFSGGYWVDQVRGTVRFADAVTKLRGLGVGRFLELGPDGGLIGAIEENCGQDGVLALPVLRRDRDEPSTAVTALSRLWVNGLSIEWAKFFATTGAQRIELPTYPFARDRYWLEGQAPAEQNGRAGSGLEYAVSWVPVSSGPATVEGSWLIVESVGVDSPWPDSLVELLAAGGVRVGRLRLDAVSGLDREVLAACIRRVLPGDCRRVVSFLGVGGVECGGVPLGVGGSVVLVQALGDVGVGGLLWSVTSGAVGVGVGDVVVDPVGAGVWGLGRVVGLEEPGRWGGLVDVPAAPDEGSVARLVEVVSGGAGVGEDQLAVRGAAVFGRRIVPAVSGGAGADSAAGAGAGAGAGGGVWCPSGTVLVTGGTGVLGVRVARWLAGLGVGRVVLASRSGGGAVGVAGLGEEFAGLGVGLEVVSCDVADFGAVEGLFGRFEFSAVVHAAGVLDDGVVDGLSVGRVGGVWGVKAGGAWNLHRASVASGRVLDAFVLFSSAAGVWGAAGQGSYAAANAFLDGLAEFRRGRGLVASSIAWGPWAEGGMAGGGVLERLGRGGVRALDPGRVVGFVGSASGCVVVADVQWPRFVAAVTAVRPSRLWERLVPDTAPAPALESVSAGGLVARLAGLGGGGRRAAVVELVRAQAAAVLGFKDVGGVGVGTAFRDLGVDSLMAVELRNALGAVAGLVLSPTVVFDYPSVELLAGFLVGELFGGLEGVGSEAGSEAGSGSGGVVVGDPVVVVGMGCRFPGGVASPEGFWGVLAGGVDAVGGFPVDRGWGAVGGVGFARVGGFVDGVAGFDAGFFGISPREALAMDPQQRVLLEVVWESLEAGGIAPGGLRGSPVGVFVGTNGQDYPALLALSDDAQAVAGYGGTGSSGSVLSGRIAYALGLEGPAITVDTACSSSLVAIHLAAQSLRSGECSLALAGGVTVMSTPAAFVEFARQGGLAGDGRCKAFSEGADGTGWGEGVGVLVLERLSDAVRCGHDVLAVVRGSAVNQDGASNGLTAPNGPSQQRVIRAALGNAGLSPADVDVVEAHGTGTSLGDPIEAQALLATYGQGRGGRGPLWLGSVKSNLGHTQAAAGVAGVIKMVLALQHEHLPKTLHAETPSSHVDWSSGAVELLTESQEWPRDPGRRRIAGVSAFGVSGTNAHVVIEEAPVFEPPAAPAVSVVLPVVPWVVSARSAAGLAGQAVRLAGVAADPLDLAFSLATTRSGLEHRAFCVDGELGSLVPAVVSGGLTGFVFSGQGGQRVGMGRVLAGTFPVFDAALSQVCAHFDMPLRGVMFEGPAGVLEGTGFAQPALFALEVALFRLFESWGVVPDFLVGHSVGELAAAHVAGSLSLEDACVLVAARAGLMQSLPAGGAMWAVRASVQEVAGLLPEGVSVASVNAPGQVVVSGERAGVEAVAAQLADRRGRWLPVSHAFHSALMDPMLAEFAEAAEQVTYHPPGIPIVSTLTGEIVEGFSGGYWVDQVRGTVRFADAVTKLRGLGVGRFLEFGPDGGLIGAIEENCGQDGVLALPVLRRDREEPSTAITTLARYWASGGNVDWPAFYTPTAAKKTALPTYAFQHEHYWPKLPQPAQPDSLEYAVTWVPVSTSPATLEGSWLIVESVGVDSPWPDSLVELLAAGGVRVGRLRLDAVSGLDREVLAACIRRVLPGDCRRVVSFLGVGGVECGGVPLGVGGSVVLVQALGDVGVGGLLWSVTSGAVGVGVGDVVVDPVGAGVWGLGRVVGLEEPGRWGGLVDVPAAPDEGSVARLVEVVSGGAGVGEDQLAVRGGGVFGRRIVPAVSGGAGADSAAGAGAGAGAGGGVWCPSGTVLVTGGTGVLGVRVARWLAGLGVGRVVLASRSGGGAVGVAGLGEEFAGLGVGLEVVSCDVADFGAVEGLFGRFEFSAVVHAAGVLDDGVVDGLSVGRVGGVWGVKAGGAWNLHRASVASGRVLDAFVLFSSAAGVWGAAGQGSYAAANAFLDGLAEFRRGRGLVASSIAWGPWAEGGMAGGGVLERLGRGGVRALDPGRVVGFVGSASGCVVVADVQWPRFVAAVTAVRPSRLWDRLVPDTAPAPALESVSAGGLVARLAGLGGGGRRAAVVELVRAQAAAVLGFKDVGGVGVGTAFRDLGVDSLMAVELRNALGAVAGLVLSPTVVFDYPTSTALADHLLSLLIDDLAAEGSGGDVRTELDRLEANVLALPAEEAARLGVVARLQQLMKRLESADGATSTVDISASIEAATADDIFDLVDREIGAQ